MKSNPAVLTFKEIVAGLTVKILLGLLYGYIYLNYYQGDDTWKHHQASISETTLLRKNPKQFFINEYTPVHALSEGTTTREVVTLYLNDLQYAIFIKSFAIVNLVTGGNYYLNMSLFNVLVFFGHWWLFACFVKRFPEKRRWFFLASFFYLPAVFWLSGLRIDGLLFFFATLFVFTMLYGTRFRKWILLPVSFAGAFICRPEFAVLIVPACVAYLLVDRYRSRALTSRPIKIYTLIYICAFALFFSSPWWMGGDGLPGIVAHKQSEFLELSGTRFKLEPLTDQTVSYFRVLPQAFANTFLRPAPWESEGLLQWAASAEVILLWLMILYIFAFRRDDAWKTRLADPFVLFIFFFSISVYLCIGALVPFPGAITRYKAIALIMLANAILTFSKLR
jgi:hypothetical protein